jgi:pullulanase/glycogen debranching enzyme
VLRQPTFFAGHPSGDNGHKDIGWLRPDGREMSHDDWVDGSRSTLGVFLAGDGLRPHGGHAAPAADSSYLIWLHSGAGPVEVTLPEDGADHYRTVFRTDEGAFGLVVGEDEPWLDPARETTLAPGKQVTLAPHTVAVFEAIAR